MSDFNNKMFDQIQKNSNIKPEEVLKVANSVQNADFSDEKTVRQLVKQLAKMADKPISKEKEDKIVKTITSKNMPKDMNTLSQLFKK
ncbi:stage VI sporulation protein F [Aquibacillus koreensis]|uniref:Stage VI sporulation protein F n=1 Tax=Aquibacillus koreensis TaxID=279446 RepID=A0A9X4AHZ2_9BACI|nr:stage VI sporulation protein F [Aquibacillus koreensis]MCT2537394.1 stage VI sporulation protein F [Aquibacillus koreensis]MDC3418840.1 stage VI sporulation protein F [Aquibacillus koreensis]